MQHVKRSGAIGAFVLAAIAAALAPLFGRTSDTAAAKDFPGWPTHHEGRALTELPLTQRELAFVHDFPGRVGRFSDGRREIIIRWVGAPTRRLHPAADCLRGSGYAITPLPGRTDAAGAAMGCFRARHGTERMTVCELIRDQRGASWPDVSAWYWNGMLGASPAPWWSFVVAERE
ncbi:MAG TPA: hypothetical protein VFB88_11365 [Xanthobacteraceae bacterium]|nr:hypothetical protein [Xanthobacteraceae bacterium]